MKIKIVIGLLIGLLIAFNGVQFFLWKSSRDKLVETYENTIASLEATIQAHGGEVTCYTVASAVMAGDEITEELLEPMTMLASDINDQYITDIDSVLGKYFKIGMSNGTPLLTDMVMSEQVRDDMRDVDIYVDRWTVGLTVGDYVDINITMPYGDDYYVLAHKRIMAIGENTLKLYLTAGEWETYQGALVDYYLNQEYGCTLYAQKYIEPGIQQSAVTFYTPPSNIAALIQKNPNVIEKEELASITTWRSSIEELLVIFRDEEDTVDSDGAKLATGRDSFNNAVTSDAVTDNEERAAEAADMQTDDDGWVSTVDSETATGTGTGTDETEEVAAE